MKTQDIKNMASAYMQVLEKAKMDKVNPKELEKDFDDREDKDIDNDGDTDKSDEYLHNRRKAVKQAMKKEAKDYGPGHIGAVQKMLDKERDAKKAKDAMKKEEVEELDELSKKTLGSYVKKASQDMANNASNFHKKAELDGYKYQKYDRKKDARRTKGINMATDKLTKEEVDLSEDISKMSHGRLKWHMNTGTPHGSYSNAEMKAERDRRMKYRDSADAYKKAKPGLSEEVEIDEAAPKIKPDFVKTQRERDRAHDAAMGRTPTGRKKPERMMTSTQRSMASMRKEDTNMSMKEKLQLQKESILEREMTDAEKKKREDIVMGMKKNKADLEKRYGSRWKDVMYATATKQAMESVDNALAMTKNLLTTKESFKTETTTWPVYARIKEANDRAMHYKSATPPEEIDSKASGLEKDFVNKHGGLGGTDSGIDGAKAAEFTAKNATTGIKAGGGMNRTGDNKTGDKNIIKSTEAK